MDNSDKKNYKRGPTGYNIFYAEYSSEYDEKKRDKNLSSLISKEWKNMSENERNRYNILSLEKKMEMIDYSNIKEFLAKSIFVLKIFPECFVLAFDYFYKVCNKTRGKIHLDHYLLYATSCLSLSVKMLHDGVKSLQYFTYLDNGNITKNQIISCERKILRLLNYNIYPEKCLFWDCEIIQNKKLSATIKYWLYRFSCLPNRKYDKRVYWVAAIMLAKKYHKAPKSWLKEKGIDKCPIYNYLF